MRELLWFAAFVLFGLRSTLWETLGHHRKLLNNTINPPEKEDPSWTTWALEELRYIWFALLFTSKNRINTGYFKVFMIISATHDNVGLFLFDCSLDFPHLHLLANSAADQAQLYLKENIQHLYLIITKLWQTVRHSDFRWSTFKWYHSRLIH